LLGGISIVAYVIIVILTSPELPASFATKAAFLINPIISYGTAFGVGANTFISSYSKGMGFRIDKKQKGIFGISSSSTALSAFFSFFSLVPLGCCGSWLLVLSYLPTIFGSALSVSLIQYSRPLSFIGLIIVLVLQGSRLLNFPYSRMSTLAYCRFLFMDYFESELYDFQEVILP